MDAGGDRAEALRIIEESHRRNPGDGETLSVLVAWNRGAGNEPAARVFEERLERLLRGNR